MMAMVISMPLKETTTRVFGNTTLSTILGESKIGNNVILSSGSLVKDARIPDNSIVFGQSPNLIIKQKSSDEINSLTKHFWR